MPLGVARAVITRRKVAVVTPAYQQILDQATADGWAAVYDPTNPNTRTLRADGGSEFFEAIADGLGNLPDIVQATADDQPELSVGEFGELDAGIYSGHLLASGAFSAAFAQPNFFAVVARNDAVSTSEDTISFGDVSGNRNGIAVTNSARDLRLFAGSGAPTSVSIGNASAVIGALFNGATSYAIANGAQSADVEPSTESLDGLRLGKNLADGLWWQGPTGPILIFDGNPSTAARDRMLDLLHDLSGIAKA